LLRLVEGVGARAVVLPAAEHDSMVAMSSHLPQLLATALGSYLHGRDLRAVAGPGLLDMTRLAMSSHELWADILATNAGNVDAALAGMIGELERVRAGLREGQLEEAFARGAAFARGLREQ
jgi:prephenate dehydrogenase